MSSFLPVSLGFTEITTGTEAFSTFVKHSTFIIGVGNLTYGLLRGAKEASERAAYPSLLDRIKLPDFKEFVCVLIVVGLAISGVTALFQYLRSPSKRNPSKITKVNLL